MKRLNEIEKAALEGKLASLLMRDGLDQKINGMVAARLCSIDHVRVQFSELVPGKCKLSEKQKALIVDILVDEGILKPIASSDKRLIAGKPYPMRYSMNLCAAASIVGKDFSSDIDSLDLRLRRTKPTYFIEHPLLFEAYRDDIFRLSNWLLTSRAGKRLATRKERSYEIWGDEKRLVKAKANVPTLGKLLGTDLGLDIDELLNTWDTVSPDFVSYILPGEGKVIVSENKDFYIDMEDLLVGNGPFSLFGETVRGVITGDGWGSSGKKFSDFRARRNVGDESLLYVGDIDIDGLGILEKFESLFGESMFAGVYNLMLWRHRDRRERKQPLNFYSENQNRRLELNSIAKRIEPDLIPELVDCLDRRIRIPQESLTRTDLEAFIEPLMPANRGSVLLETEACCGTGN